MYLMINGNRHSVSRRMVTKNTIKFLSVEPKPETISGKIQMFENNGFPISEDNADNFLHSTYSGTLLVLTNIPESKQVERPAATLEVTTDDMANAILEGVNEV